MVQGWNMGLQNGGQYSYKTVQCSTRFNISLFSLQLIIYKIKIIKREKITEQKINQDSKIRNNNHYKMMPEVKSTFFLCFFP